MFKVLMIAYYFPPMGLSGVQRTLKFAKYLSDYNWRPTIITTGKTGYFAHDESLLREAEGINAEIIRTEAYDPNSLLKNFGTIKMPRDIIRKIYSRISKTIFVPDNKTAWAKKAYKKAKELLEKEEFDAIYVTVPPFSSFMHIAKLKKHFDIPIFVDYRDLWFGNQFSFYPTPYHKYLHKKYEYNALKAAERVVVVNRKIKEFLLTTYKFLSFDDIIIIPHGYDSADFTVEIPDTRPRAKKVVFTYSGIFYESVTPKYFLKAFKQLTKERPDVTSGIELHFIGYLQKENRSLVKRLNLDQYVVEYGYLDHNETIVKIMNSDVLWVTLGDTKGMDTVTPGKLFEYFGSRKVILGCLPEGIAKTTAREYGPVYFAHPENIEEIKQAILQIYEDIKKKNLEPLNEEFIEKYDRKRLTEELSKNFQFFLKGES